MAAGFCSRGLGVPCAWRSGGAAAGLRAELSAPRSHLSERDSLLRGSREAAEQPLSQWGGRGDRAGRVAVEGHPHFWLNLLPVK